MMLKCDEIINIFKIEVRKLNYVLVVLILVLGEHKNINFFAII